MKKRSPLTLLLALILALPAGVYAQPASPPGFIPRVVFADLPEGVGAGTVRFVTNTDGNGCNGDGSTTLLCGFDGGSWNVVGAGSISGGTGDIEGVTAGTGLTGGGSTGTVTLNVDATSPLAAAADTLTCATCTTNASALTSNLPVIGAGGNATAVGTRSGNTTEFATITGSKTTGKQLAFDASGNVIASPTDIGAGGSGTPGGSDTQVQFNNASAFGGDAGLTYNSGTDTLTVAGDVVVGAQSVCLEDGTNCPASSGTDDQTAAEVPFTPTGTIAASDTQAAVAEVATDAASALSSHAADTTAIHGITDTSALETTTGAQTKVDTHVNDTTAAHAASALSVTPFGTIAATDVQSALEEIVSEGGGGGGGGNVSTSGSPSAGQVAYFASGTTIAGDADFTFDSVNKTLNIGSASGHQITYGHDTLTADRVVTSPDADSVTVIPSSAPSNQFATGVDSTSKEVTYAQPSFANLSGTTGLKVRTCEIVIGDPGAASPALADDNDTPVVCSNVTGASMTITAVKCYADAGTPSVRPIISGGSSTSILSGDLTCGTGSFATGTLNGTPTQADGATINGEIATAGGTAKYIVIRIERTL